MKSIQNNPEQSPKQYSVSWRNKVLSLVLLSILLLIPSLLIMQLTSERQKRKDEAYHNIGDMWGKPQTVSGFYFRIPHKDGDKYIYPEDLEVLSELSPQTRKRGIYSVPVYTNKVGIKSKFKLRSNSQTLAKLSNKDLSTAQLCFEIYDVSKGLDTDIKVQIDGQSYEADPLIRKSDVEYYDGQEDQRKTSDLMQVSYPLSREKLIGGIDMQAGFSLNGTEYFEVIPTAIHNSIQMSGSWEDPSAVGNRLPSEPLQVKDGKFDTQWNFINRAIATVSSTRVKELDDESVGVSLLITVDNYTKVERSLKYAILIIVLCFAAMFLLEVFNKKELNIVHYALTGLSLIVFYILLLSISEYTGFDLAYLISSLATIFLLIWFVGGILRSTKLGAYLGAVLAIVYTYNFILLNAREYALLMGSIGLFAVVFILMYFTRKINFDK